MGWQQRGRILSWKTHLILWVCLISLPSLVNAQEKTSVGFNPLKHLAKAPGWLIKTEVKAFKKSNVKYWGSGVGAVAIAYLFDDKVDRYFKKKERFPDVARFFDKTGHKLNQGLWAVVYLSGLFAKNERLVRTGQAMIIAELGANLVGSTLWFAIGRERPGTAPDHHTFHPFDTDNLNFAKFPPFKVLPSFPSSHVSGNFCIATVISRYYGFKYGLPMYLFGTATGFSRIARQGHYLSDVVGGAFLGTIFGYAATEVLEVEQKVFGRVQITPHYFLGHRGFKISLLF